MKFCVILAALVSLSAGASIDQRIVNGEMAEADEKTFQLSLQLDGSHICGAVAIARNIALTAAHCVDFSGYHPSRFSFACGLHNLMDSGQVSVATDIIMHEQWNPNGLGFPNDIAVVKVDPPFNWEAGSCERINLPPNNLKQYAGKDGVISGWGRLFGNGPLAGTLKKAVIPVVSNSVCGSYYDSFGGLIKVIQNYHICVRDPNAQMGACNGDSGGPMTIIDRDNGVKKLVGVTSFGRSGCDTSYPSVYTRTSYYTNWIQQKMDQLGASED